MFYFSYITLKQCYRPLMVLILVGLLNAVGGAKIQPTDPEVIYMFPLGGSPGTEVVIEVLGRNLEDTQNVWVDTAAIEVRVISQEIGMARLREGKLYKVNEITGQKIKLRVQIHQNAKIGPHALRLISSKGVSNALIFWVVPVKNIIEIQKSHDTKEKAQSLTVPVAISGKIDKEGETDYYKFRGLENQELAFEVVEGVQRMLGDVRRAPGFSLELYGPNESWFDHRRDIKLGATNTIVFHKYIANFKPRLVYRFKKSDWYHLRVSGELGASYQLQIASPSQLPALIRRNGLDKLARDRWKERDFFRRLSVDRMRSLQRRSEESLERASLALMEEQLKGFMDLPIKQEEDVQNFDEKVSIFHEKEPNDSPKESLSFSIPSILEGTIDQPADTDFFAFKLEDGADLALEIETPDSPYPFFNPRVTVIDEYGKKVVDNIYKRQASQNMWFWKTAEAKTIFKVKNGGKFFLKIADVTRRKGNSHFKYRLMIRPQVPHVGEVEVAEVLNILGREMLDWMIELDRVNLFAGEIKKINVVISREEGFTGELAVVVENLPTGVTVIPGADVGPKLDLPQDQGEKERFKPNDQVVTVLLAVAPDAPPTLKPQFIKFNVQPVQVERLNRYRRMSGEAPFRPIWERKMGERIFVHEVPMMVLQSPSSDSVVNQVASESD